MCNVLGKYSTEHPREKVLEGDVKALILGRAAHTVRPGKGPHVHRAANGSFTCRHTPVSITASLHSGDLADRVAHPV